MRIPWRPRGPWLPWLLLGAFLAMIASLFVPVVQVACWVGATDLEIEWVVTDAATGEAVRGATILVAPSNCREIQFSLVTDENGRAKRSVNCGCSGRSGWNIDTCFVHLPNWYFLVSAKGYIRSECEMLDDPENFRRVQGGSPTATLLVPITLDRKAG